MVVTRTFLLVPRIFLAVPRTCVAVPCIRESRIRPYVSPRHPRLTEFLFAGNITLSVRVFLSVIE